MTTNDVFKCATCKQTKPVLTGNNTCCPEYGVDRRNHKHCWACCGERDKADMLKSGKATLYLDTSARTVSNWPGTLKFGVNRLSVGRHNIAGKRYDVWFVGPNGESWYGYTVGDMTQICHCKRIKG